MGYLLNRVAAALRAEVTERSSNHWKSDVPAIHLHADAIHPPGRSNAELARDVNVSPQAMNMVVRGLQDRGLVARPAAVSSGRSLPAELTREGDYTARTASTPACARPSAVLAA